MFNDNNSNYIRHTKWIRRVNSKSRKKKKKCFKFENNMYIFLPLYNICFSTVSDLPKNFGVVIFTDTFSLFHDNTIWPCADCLGGVWRSPEPSQSFHISLYRRSKVFPWERRKKTKKTPLYTRDFIVFSRNVGRRKNKKKKRPFYDTNVIALKKYLVLDVIPVIEKKKKNKNERSPSASGRSSSNNAAAVNGSPNESWRSTRAGRDAQGELERSTPVSSRHGKILFIKRLPPPRYYRRNVTSVNTAIIILLLSSQWHGNPNDLVKVVDAFSNT